MVQTVTSDAQQQQVVELLGRFHLDFEPEWDDLVGVWDSQGALLATGARRHALLKMIAVADDAQNGELFGELVSELIRRGYEAGLETFFVFTKPENVHSFAAVNFRLLCLSDQVALLEYGPGLKRYFKQHRALQRPGHNGAVVVNCNPFTLGHRYLIETAARQVDWLYVFVVEEDRSSFPFDVRLDLVRKGVADLDNVLVVPSGPYAVSRITFPGYFLKDSSRIECQQHQMDAQMFSRHLAPQFNICRRFVGSEPYCATTERYNVALKRLLPEQGIEVQEVPRVESRVGAISASQVRKLLRQRAREALAQLVPETTLAYLLSPACERTVRWGLIPGRH